MDAYPYLYMLVVLAVSGLVVADTIPVCEDDDTAACSLFLANKPDMCQDDTLSPSCQRFCGRCPLVCYNCPTAVNITEDCNATTLCAADEACMQKQHTYPDGSSEYIMGCELKSVCEGVNIGFHDLIGKRDILDDERKRRDLRFHCCDVDFCNYPAEFVTTVPPPTTSTQPPTSLKPLHNCSVDLVFVLDGSTSIGDVNHRYLRQFVQTIISQLTIGPADALVAVIEYSDSARVEWYLTDHRNMKDLQLAASKIPYVRGSTATHAAFWLTRNSVLTSAHGARPNAHDVVVLVTDGGTDLPGQAISEAKLLHDQGVEIITVGVGRGTDTHELDQIHTNHLYNVTTFAALRSITGTVLSNLCA